MTLLAHWRSWLALVTPALLTAIPLMGEPDMQAAMWTLYTITRESVQYTVHLYTYRVFHNNRPKIMAYCSKIKSPGDFLRLLGAYQMWSIW